MTRPLRMFEADKAYFITNRTFQGRPFMTPNANINNIVGAALARAISKHDVRVYAYVFMSNHFHILVSGPGDQIARFMQYLQSVIARRINPLNAWRGSFFERRYSATCVEDDEALFGRLRYILAHGVKENLVARCAEWPGANAVHQLCTGTPDLFTWRNWTGTKEEELKLSPLPQWAELTALQRQQQTRSMVAEIEQQAQEQRTLEETQPLGPAKVTELNPRRRPSHLSRAAGPLCHASTAQGHADFRARLNEFIAAYRVASARFRAGFWDVLFPEQAFRPLGFCLPAACT